MNQKPYHPPSTLGEIEKAKPSVYIAMPCYDSVKIGTMLSIVQLIQQLAKSRCRIQTRSGLKNARC